jgi:hypothetical protein
MATLVVTCPCTIGLAEKPKGRFPMAIQRLELLLDMLVRSLLGRLGRGKQTRT